MRKSKQLNGMNQEYLKAIKKRLAKTSVGPWRVSKLDIEQPRSGNLVVSDALHIAKTFFKSYDAEFIASCREDVPILVAEVERLSEELTQQNVKQMGLVLEIADQKLQKREYIKTIHLVNEENKRLREALEFYANNSNYLIEWSDKCDEYMPSVADNDGGEIARQALDGESDER